MKRSGLFTLWIIACAGGCALRDHDQPMKLGGALVPAAALNRGKEGYNLYCRACHGDDGDGRGASAPGLRPPPRDFTQGLFKFGGVPAPGLPPDAELRRIVRGGLHGTAMLPWDIPDEELAPILHYIKTFSPRWREEAAAAPVEIAPDPFGPARRGEAIALGRRAYHAKAQCSSCHPAYVSRPELRAIVKAQTGTEPESFSPTMYEPQPKDSEYCLAWKPAQPAASQTRDRWIEARECARPVRVVPPDFTRTPLRSVRLPKNAPAPLHGAEPVTERTALTDLYRTIAAGVGGANMPAWKGALAEDELWGLAYYVMSLVELGDRPAELQRLRAGLAVDTDPPSR